MRVTFFWYCKAGRATLREKSLSFVELVIKIGPVTDINVFHRSAMCMLDCLRPGRHEDEENDVHFTCEERIEGIQGLSRAVPKHDILHDQLP